MLQISTNIALNLYINCFESAHISRFCSYLEKMHFVWFTTSFGCVIVYEILELEQFVQKKYLRLLKSSNVNHFHVDSCFLLIFSVNYIYSAFNALTVCISFLFDKVATLHPIIIIRNFPYGKHIKAILLHGLAANSHNCHAHAS